MVLVVSARVTFDSVAFTEDEDEPGWRGFGVMTLEVERDRFLPEAAILRVKKGDEVVAVLQVPTEALRAALTLVEVSP